MKQIPWTFNTGVIFTTIVFIQHKKGMEAQGAGVNIDLFWNKSALKQ